PGGSPAGPAPRLRRGAGDGGGVLRGHQLPPHLPDAGLCALRRREPPPVRPVLRGVLHALGLLRAVQRTEDRLLQIPHPVDRPEGGVTRELPSAGTPRRGVLVLG